MRPYARFYSGQGHSQGSRKGSNFRFALIPVLLGVGGTSTLWLDSPNTGAAADPGSNGGITSKHSLQSILDNVEKPDADEFLIAADADDDPDEDDSPPPRRLVFVRNVRHFLREYLVEPISTGLRFLQLAIIFLPVLLSAPILCLELVDDSRDRRRGRPPRTKERRTTRWWYYLLVHQMEMAGPTFIKVSRPPISPTRKEKKLMPGFLQLAQWAGSRTDLFPAELCNLFGKLHSQGKPHSFRYTKRVIERAFGLPFERIFVEFRETPLGIGAIAQVYKAVLNPDLLPEDYLALKHTDDPAPTARLSRTIVPMPDDKRPKHVPGATVAIKVLHPRVEKQIGRDLKIMMFFAKALNALPGMEWLSFPEEVQVFGQMMMSQVDLRIEANNLGEPSVILFGVCPDNRLISRILQSRSRTTSCTGPPSPSLGP